MSLHDYFIFSPIKENGYKTKYLSILDEIKIASLWTELMIYVHHNSGIVDGKVILLLKYILELSLSEHPAIDSSNLDFTIDFVSKNIIDKINYASKDDTIKPYFYNPKNENNKPNEELIKLKGYMDYIGFVIFNFGQDYLEKLNMSQIYILKRFKEIENAELRLINIYDGLIYSNYDKKSFKDHTKSIKDILKMSYNIDTIKPFDIDVRGKTVNEIIREKNKVDPNMTDKDIREQAMKERLEATNKI